MWTNTIEKPKFLGFPLPWPYSRVPNTVPERKEVGLDGNWLIICTVSSGGTYVVLESH